MIRSLSTVAILGGLALGAGMVSGCGQSDTGGGNASAAVKAAAAQRGATVFNSVCVACHGPTGVGVPKLGKDLVHSPFVKAKSDTDLVDFIKKGRDISDPENTTKVAMPARGGNNTLTDTQLADVVQYVRQLQAKG